MLGLPAPSRQPQDTSSSRRGSHPGPTARLQPFAEDSLSVLYTVQEAVLTEHLQSSLQDSQISPLALEGCNRFASFVQGLQWMLDREQKGYALERGHLHLHPAWLQLRAADGQLLYVSRMPHISRHHRLRHCTCRWHLRRFSPDLSVHAFWHPCYTQTVLAHVACQQTSSE